MKSLVSVGLSLGCAAVLSASGGTGRQTDNRVPIRLPIRHADPWAVKAMMEGSSITQPELSTILGVRGGAMGRNATNGQAGNSPLLQDGFLVVNPTDNSLWWYPKK